MPSHGVQAARERPWNGGVEATASAVGCRLHAPGQARQVLGHLDGWGRGLGEVIRTIAIPGGVAGHREPGRGSRR